jgi:uncharacterized protein (TIGR00251 family)
VSLRVAIWVRPGASKVEIGGRHGDALVVRVTARAVEGKATEAALRALAEALSVRRRDVRLVAGTTSRHKIVEVDGPAAALRARLGRFLAG